MTDNTRPHIDIHAYLAKFDPGEAEACDRRVGSQAGRAWDLWLQKCP